MNYDAVQEEIKNIDSYAPMISRWQQLGIKSAKIVTLEGEKIIITVDSEGWNDGEEVYPTVEALLHSRSPGFTREWNRELFKKLNALRR